MFEVASTFLQVGPLRMHLLSAGDPSKPLVVMLHGFPELAESWRDILPMMADGGFYAVAPDLRGYGGTDKPDGGYDLDTLSGDVAALIEALGRKEAHVVGHDWGGAIAYHFAATHPARVQRLAVVNCPHPVVLATRLFKDGQLRRSWYMFAFQLPWLPELFLSRNGGANVARSLRGMAIDKTNFTREKLAPYAQNFSSQRAARSALNYYREAMKLVLSAKGRALIKNFPKIRAPFRLIWGTEDTALGVALTKDFDEHFEQPVDVKYLPGVGHFATLEAPQKVAPLLLEHLSA